MSRLGLLFLRGALNILLSGVFLIWMIPALVIKRLRRKGSAAPVQVFDADPQDYSLPDALKDRHDDTL